MAQSREMAQSDASPTKGFATWQALTKALFDDYRPELHYMPIHPSACARLKSVSDSIAA